MARNEVYDAFESQWKTNLSNDPKKSMYHDIKPLYARTTPARLLCGFCEINQIPDNVYVRKEFGFDKVPSDEQSKILGLFRDIRTIGVTVEELEYWHADGTLVEKVEETFCEYGPPEILGQNFEWFLQHKSIFQGTS